MGKNSSTYNDAATILMERFPKLGLMSGTWAAVELQEDEWTHFEVGKAEALYFYGLGKGSIYFQWKKWLKESPARQIVFLEDEPGLIASFLHLPEAEELLRDPQVHLELLSKKGEEIEALVRRFPAKRIEVAALKSKKGFKNLRVKLLRKMALAYGLHIDRLHGYQPFKNFVENLVHLPRSFYANKLRGSFRNVPAIVCGAGPSLQASIEDLKALQTKALIIAGGSTLAALSSQGILPHFGMAIDPNLEEYRRLKNSFAFEVPLLYSTRVHPAIFQTCNGPFGYMRSGIGGIPEVWMEEELGLLDPLMGQLLSAETISVTAICVAWAQFLGCNPILINGVDMAYTGNRRYASGVADEQELAFQSIDQEKSAADRILKRKDRNGLPVYTAIRWVMESASISDFASQYPKVRFINTTEGGIGFKGIDYVPLKEASRHFKDLPLKKRVFEQIAKHPMPSYTQEKTHEKMGELAQSLDRLIGYLQVLSGEKKGSAALAEIELQEEIAYLYLFYDIYQILKPGADFWKEWLDLALKYKQVLYRSQ